MLFSLFLFSIHGRSKNRSCLFSTECSHVSNTNINNNTGRESILYIDPSKKNSSTLHKKNNNNDGWDERFLYMKRDDVMLNKIDGYNRKMDLLRFLQNNSNNIWEKIKRIEYSDFEKQSPYLPDISRGGLFHDWDTEIF